jgi:hypothetical protein
MPESCGKNHADGTPLAFPEWGFRPAGLNANGLSAQFLDAKKITPGWRPEIRNSQFAIPFGAGSF